MKRNYHLIRGDCMNENDKKMVEEVKRISAKGHNAEVKQNQDGTWTIYDVKKEKKKVG